MFYSCSNFSKKELGRSDQLFEDSLKKESNQILSKVTFRNIEGSALLIGDKIELLDQDLKPIENISNQSTTLIELLGVSDSLFNQTNEICNAFWYVKVKVKGKVGIINGRQVFQIYPSKQDTSFMIGDKKFEILTTQFFGMGVDYQGDLMGCPVDQPILLKDERNNFFGLVEINSNEIYKKTRRSDHLYPFFELRNDDGFYDKIDSIIFQDSNCLLKIHRGFQEGENDYEVLLRFEQNKYFAEYLNYGEIKY